MRLQTLQNLEFPIIAQTVGKKLKNAYYLRSGKADWPKTIFISINSVCNSRCLMCDVGMGVQGSQFFKNLRIDGNKPVELKLERLKKLVDETKHFKPLMAVISTEPLLYKDLFKFASYARKCGLEVAITTNGILLKKYAQDFVKSDINRLWVSIDGPEKIHNQIRRIPNIFKLAINGIKEVEYWKKKLGKTNPVFGINYTISNYNYFAITDFMESIMPLRPETVTISHYNYVSLEMAKEHNQKYGQICRATSSCVSAVDLKKIKPKVLLKQLNMVKKKYRSKTNLGFAPDLKTEKEIFDFYNNPHIVVAQKKCRAAWNIAQILANGDLNLSTRCFNMSLGNINETSFAGAWNSDKFRQFRKIIDKEGMFIPACTRCCAVL